MNKKSVLKLISQNEVIISQFKNKSSNFYQKLQIQKNVRKLFSYLINLDLKVCKKNISLQYPHYLIPILTFKTFAKQR